jgi:hypothetical protein
LRSSEAEVGGWRFIDKEMEFVAARFHDLPVDDLKRIRVSVLERIANSGRLRLQSEDSVLDFICSLDSGDQIVLVLAFCLIRFSIRSFGSLLAAELFFRFRLTIWNLRVSLGPLGAKWTFRSTFSSHRGVSAAKLAT